MAIVLPEPNPRRRPVMTPTPPPPGRRAGIAALPEIEDPESFLTLPGGVIPGQGSMRGRVPEMSTADRAAEMIRQMESGLPTGRPFSALVGDRDTLRVTRNPYEILADRQRQAGDLATGTTIGLTADIAGLPADLLALAFSDAPRFVGSLVSGKSFEEMPKNVLDEGFLALRNVLGGDAIARFFGVTEEALQRPGVQSGRLLAAAFDPFILAGLFRKAFGAGSRSTDALADAAAGDAAARQQVEGEILEPEAGPPIVSTQPQAGFTGQVDPPPQQTPAETIIEGEFVDLDEAAEQAAEVFGGVPGPQSPAGAPRMPEDGPDPVELIDPDAVMPMTASRNEVARITPTIRPMETYSRTRPAALQLTGATQEAPIVSPADRRFIEESRAGSVIDYSPLFQRVNALDTSRTLPKSEVLDSLRAGSKESLEKDRRGSGFIEFLEKFGPGTLTRGEVVELYRKYTPQVRVRSVTTTELNTPFTADSLVTGPPIASLPDFNQKTFDGARYGILVGNGFEKIHVYFANPNSQLPLNADGSRTLQLESYSDHGFGVTGGVGRQASAVGTKETGVPGYYGHARFNAVQNDNGRIAVFQEGQSNQGKQETESFKGENFVNYTDNSVEAIAQGRRDGQDEYIVVSLDKIAPNPNYGVTTEFKGKVTDPNTGEVIPRGTKIVFPGISRRTLEDAFPREATELEDVLRVFRYFPESREWLASNQLDTADGFVTAPQANRADDLRDMLKHQRVRSSAETKSDLIQPPEKFRDLQHDSVLPSNLALGGGGQSLLSKIREAYPGFGAGNRIRSVIPRPAGARNPAEEMVMNIRDNPTAPLADSLPQGYRAYRFDQAAITADGREFFKGDLILLPEEFATETGETGLLLVTEFIRAQSDRMLPDVQIEGTPVKTVEGPPRPRVVPFTGQERRLLEDLRSISPETSRIFDETVNSSRVRQSPEDDPFVEKFFAGQQQADGIFQQFEDDRLIIGGDRPTADETREILDAVNQNMTQFEPVAGGFREMTDLVLDVVPTRLAQLMERLDNTDMDQTINLSIPGHPDDTGLRPVTMTLVAETRNLAALTSHDVSTLLLDDLSPEQINKFNSGFLARLEDVDARNATTQSFEEKVAFFEAEGSTRMATINYENVSDEFTRFDEGDPNARSPYEYFREKGPANLAAFMSNDPALFGHIANRKISGPGAEDYKPLNETNSDPRLIMSRAIKHRIKVALDEKLDDAITARRPAGDQTLRDDVPVEDSIQEMNDVIDGPTFPPVSDARKKEFKEAFETYANTVHRAGGGARTTPSPLTRRGIPLPGSRIGQDRVYTVSTPFVGRNSTSDNARHMYRLAIAEVEAAGFDGAIFPNWMDQYDARANQGFKKPAAQRVYEIELMAALKEMGYKVKADNRGPADVVIEPTIMATNNATGAVEPLPVAATGEQHRPAIAIYFNRDRVRTRRNTREEREATGQQTREESLGTNRDMLVSPDGTRKLMRRAEGGPVDLRPRKLVHSGIGAMARQVM